MSFLSFLLKRFKPKEHVYNVTNEECDLVTNTCGRIKLQLWMSNISFKRNNRFKTIEKIISSKITTHEKIQMISGYSAGYLAATYELNKFGRMNYDQAIQLTFSVIFGNDIIAQDIYNNIFSVAVTSMLKENDKRDPFHDMFIPFKNAFKQAGHDVVSMNESNTPKLGLYHLLSGH